MANSRVQALKDHRFVVLIVGTVLVSLTLVVISMVIYSSSGAAQLDLSRPAFQSVSNQVEKSTDVTEFGSTGPLTREIVDEFSGIYKAQADRAKAVDAFGGDPLNPETLLFGAGETIAN